MNDTAPDPLLDGLPNPDVPEALTPYWRLGATVFAPILTPFARWIVSQAQGRIFVVLREGRFLGRLIAATARDLGRDDLAIGEIWLSHRAVTGAALFPHDLSALGDLVAVAPGETVDEVLGGIGLTRGDVETVLPGFDMRRPGALAALTQAIAATETLREKVLARSAERRRNLLKGLAQHFDGANAQNATLVMLGFSNSTQVLLARILAHEGWAGAPHGLYFALSDASENTNGTAFITDPTAVRLLVRTPEVLEHASSSRGGNLSHYDDAGAPLLLASQRSALQLDQMEALQAGILARAGAINRNLGDLARAPPEAAAADVAQRVVRLMLHPTREEAEAIGGWQHDDNFDLTDRRRLADIAFDPGLLEYRGLAALAAVTRQNTYWPGAAFSMINPFLGEAFAATSQGSISPNLLTSGPLLGVLTFIPDFGAGFDTTRARAAALALNAFGRGELRVLVKPFGPETLTRIKLVWPAAQAVVAVAPPVLVGRGEREARGLPLSGLSWEGTREIQQGLQLTTGVAAETVLELGSPPPFPHALELTLRFKYLRLTPMFAQR